MAAAERHNPLSLDWKHASLGHYVARNGCEVSAEGGLFFGRRWWAMVPNIVGSKRAGWRALADSGGVMQFKTSREAMLAAERFCASIGDIGQDASSGATT